MLFFFAILRVPIRTFNEQRFTVAVDLLWINFVCRDSFQGISRTPAVLLLTYFSKNYLCQCFSRFICFCLKWLLLLNISSRWKQMHSNYCSIICISKALYCNEPLKLSCFFMLKKVNAISSSVFWFTQIFYTISYRLLYFIVKSFKKET